MTDIFENRKRKIILISRFLIVFFVFAIMFFPSANAAASNDKAVSMINQITKGPLEKALELFNNGLFEKITASDFVEKYFPEVTKVITILGLGITIIIAFFNLFKSMEDGKDPVETVFKLLIEIAIAALIILNSGYIIDLINRLGMTIIDSFSPTIDQGANTVSPEEIIKAIDGTGKTKGGAFWEWGIMFFLLLPWLASLLLELLIKFVITQIIFEIALKKLFFPLALADVYHEGPRSPGFRYIKRFFAVYIKLAICLAVMALSSLFTILTEGTAGMDYLMSMILINFTAASLMMKGSELANDIVG